MKDKLETKTKNFIKLVTADPRWDLQDELMVQVLGFTLYGYAFGIGRLSLFMDVEEINSITVNQLVNLGVGSKYVQGLIDTAYNSFVDEQKNRFTLN